MATSVISDVVKSSSDITEVADASYGFNTVTKYYVDEDYHFFQKQTQSTDRALLEYLSSKLIVHVEGIPYAPVLFGQQDHEICSLRMTFNTAGGSLHDVLIKQLENGTAKVPDIIFEIYEKSKDIGKTMNLEAHVDLIEDYPDHTEELEDWELNWAAPYYEDNKTFISKLFAFRTLMNDEEDLNNLNNLIVNTENPSKFLYAIDMAPYLLKKQKHEWMEPIEKGHNQALHVFAHSFQLIDENVFNQTSESFQDILTDEVINECVEDAITSLATLSGNTSDIQYSQDLKTILKWRRDHLACNLYNTPRLNIRR